MITLIQFLQSGIGISLLSAIIATLIPSPFDFLHFYLQNYIYTHKIKRLNFEILQVMDWYFLDSIYYALIFILAYLLEINNLNTITTITIITTVLGLGAVIGIISKFLLSKHKFR